MKKGFLLLAMICISFVIFANDVSIAMETYIPMPESWKEKSFTEKQIAVLDILTNISTQKGIKYISKTAGNKPKTLFEDAFIIQSLEKPNSKVEDPKINELPQEPLVLAINQTDNRFGSNTFTATYELKEDGITLTIVNHSAMKFLFVTCVESNDLAMVLDITIQDNGFSVVEKATVKNQEEEIHIPFYTVDVKGSFERRINALKDWFEDQLNSYSF